METTGGDFPSVSTPSKRPPGEVFESRAYTVTESNRYTFTHSWLTNNVSAIEKRFLETNVEFIHSEPDTFQYGMEELVLETNITKTFRARFHPKGNKDSNKDFCFFQVFPVTPVSNYRVKFHVYNMRSEPLPLTVYQGNQQLNGYFEYVRRDALLQHIAPEDELMLKITLTFFSEPWTHMEVFPKERGTQLTDDVGKDFEALFKNPQFSDFKIKCKYDGKVKVLNVHKAILVARSQFFKAMLSEHTKESKDNEVIFDDIDHSVLLELVRFIYTGKAPKVDSMALELMGLADRFQVLVLKRMAEKSLLKKLNVSNVCEVLVVADVYNSEHVKQEALNYIGANASEVVKTDGWQAMLKDHSQLLTDVVMKINNGGNMEPLAKRIRKF
ncbi:unnamed protein product [Bursaphelenchus okinawaensis]|uniref:BTB domain-containing protein n=1 Tax=Bursaphelenchus okinawaensis TaxID=465554 RepID=A0A811K8D1_9BILA|nr:unnamed protein product [Bursaphelenchus okinawaensis]CAG9095809.1 unnamed protein product [Bursaphelenchus okinawaensis]